MKSSGATAVSFESGPRFIVQFTEAFDIPKTDFRSCDPYLRAFVWQHAAHTLKDNIKIHKPERISEIVTTLRKVDCTSEAPVIWNSYRDFRVNPPEGSVLTVEIYHATTDSIRPESDILLGKVDIPIATLRTPTASNHHFIPTRATDRQKYPQFGVRLRRVFIDTAPPRRKTFFLIRHGESKWNEAQAKISISGMLDRDHALTERGIQQAADLNRRWKVKYFLHTDKDQTVSGRNSLSVSARNSSCPQPPQVTNDLLDFEGLEPPTSSSENIIRKDDPIMPSVSTVATSTDVWGKNDRLFAFINDIAHDDDNLRAHSFDSDDHDHSNNNLAFDEDDDSYLFEERPNIIGEFMQETIDTASSRQNRKDELIDAFHDKDMKLTTSSGFVDQSALEQRREEYINLFMHVDGVYSSPLTRALETAAVAMEDHPALLSNGLTLYSVVREIKRIGGLDTVGVECGDGIEHRLRAEMASILGYPRAEELTKIPIIINDCNQPWWTPLAGHDSEKEQQERVREFLTFIRYCDSQVPVFVGHSLFFKAFYSKRVSNDLLKNRRALSENLKKFRLSNAALLAVTVTFHHYQGGGGQSEAIMIDADLIFGGSFHGLRPDPDSEEGKALAAEEVQSNNSNNNKPRKPPARRASTADTSLMGALGSDLKKELDNKKQAVTNGLKKFGNAMKDFWET